MGKMFVRMFDDNRIYEIEELGEGVFSIYRNGDIEDHPIDDGSPVESQLEMIEDTGTFRKGDRVYLLTEEGILGKGYLEVHDKDLNREVVPEDYTVTVGE